MGINLVLYLTIFLFNNDHPHMIDSLFAIAIVFENLIISNVGFNHSNPEIALIV